MDKILKVFGWMYAGIILVSGLCVLGIEYLLK